MIVKLLLWMVLLIFVFVAVYAYRKIHGFFLQKQRLKEKVALLEKEVKERYKFGNIIGKGCQLLQLL